jgi:hypothetical protein
MIVILEDKGLKQMLLEEGYKSGHYFKPGITKMYRDLRKKFGDRG